MRSKSIAQGATYVLLVSSLALLSAFRTDHEGSQSTYLHKVSSPAGQTRMEYNADRSIRKIVQQYKTENAAYTDVQLPVYENGRLVKILSADDEQAVTGDLVTTFSYKGENVEKISYYRSNAVYTYDSLVYNEAGKLAFRYQFNRNPANGVFQNSGYQQYSWDAQGNISAVDNYGKQPGYSKFVAVSTVTYTYDNKQHPQQLHQALSYLPDATAAGLSAHNILSESISTPNTSRVITNTWTYAYNADKYPVRGTFSSGLDASTVKLEWVKLQ